MAWQAPTDSIVHGSARRLDPARVSRGFAFGLALMTVGFAAAVWSVYRARDASLESQVETLVRDAERAPWVVTAFLLGLCFAGTTKRCFGFGLQGAVGLALGFGSAVVAARCEMDMAASVAVVVGVSVSAVTRTRWRRVVPWVALAFGASFAVALASVGIAPTRWSGAAERAVALGLLTVGTGAGAALGLWTCRWNSQRS